MKLEINLLMLLFITINNVTFGASFNCNKASKKVEFAICNYDLLNEADTELGIAYKELKTILSEEEFIKLRGEQRLWIKQRDEVCVSSSEDCLLSQITSRTQELKRKIEIKKYATSNIPEYQPSYSYKTCDTEIPTLACSPENRNEKAFAMCAMVMGGCEVVINQLDESGQRLVTNQVCNAMVSELSGEQYDVNAMLNSFVTDLISEGVRNSDNGFVQFFLGATSIVLKVHQFDQCINQASNNCSRIYNEWRSKC